MRNKKQLQERCPPDHRTAFTTQAVPLGRRDHTDKVGGNPSTLNWVTRITAEKVWQLNNRGLKVNSCYSATLLEEQWWIRGCHPQPPCLQKVDKTQINASAEMPPGLEQRQGRKMGQKPSKTLVIKTLLSHRGTEWSGLEQTLQLIQSQPPDQAAPSPI